MRLSAPLPIPFLPICSQREGARIHSLISQGRPRDVRVYRTGHYQLALTSTASRRQQALDLRDLFGDELRIGLICPGVERLLQFRNA